MIMILYNDNKLQFNCYQERPRNISDSLKDLICFVCLVLNVASTLVGH